MYYTNHNLFAPIANSTRHMNVYVTQHSVEDDMEQSTTVRAIVVFSESYAADMDDRDMKDEIVEEFRMRCGCDWDCCGHTNGWGIPMKKLGKRSWLVIGHYAANY